MIHNACINGVVRERFEIAMSFFFEDFGNGSETKAVSYTVDEKSGLVLHWHKSAKGSTLLPYEMKMKACIEFAWHWLQGTEYPDSPDTNGSTEKAWKVFNQQFIHKNNDDGYYIDCEDIGFYGIVAIKPTWAVYGK